MRVSFQARWLTARVLQPSPSTSSLSSTHSASPNVTSSAPSSARGQCRAAGGPRPFRPRQRGPRAPRTPPAPADPARSPFLLSPASPLLSDKHKHSRENSCLSPRERPCSAVYPTPLEPCQVILWGWKGLELLPCLCVNTRRPAGRAVRAPAGQGAGSARAMSVMHTRDSGKPREAGHGFAPSAVLLRCTGGQGWSRGSPCPSREPARAAITPSWTPSQSGPPGSERGLRALQGLRRVAWKAKIHGHP